MPSQLPYPLHLSGDLALRSIAELHAKLTEALAAHEAIAIETADVESIDTAALQLLVSAARTAEARGRALTLVAAEGGVVARALVAGGLFAADGSPKTPTLSSWTISREAA